MTGPQAAIVLFALVTVFVVGSVVFTASQGDEPTPVAPPTTALVAESATLGFEPDDVASGDESRSSVAAMVAGFGLIGLWIVGVGVALGRARRRRVDVELDPA